MMGRWPWSKTFKILGGNNFPATKECPSGIGVICRRWLSTPAKAEIEFNILYSPEDKRQIIQAINDIQDPEDYGKYKLSKKAIKQLTLRNKYGIKIKDFDELVGIIGEWSSTKVFCLILDRPVPNMRYPMVPYPTEQEVENISQVVSIVMNGYQVSVCNIQRHKETKQLVVKNLQQEVIAFRTRMHFISLLNEMAELANNIPSCELCLFEEYNNNSPIPPNLFGFALHMAQIRSNFLGCYSARPEAPKIAAIKSQAVARIFNIHIGGERVSGQHLVDNMLTWKPLPSIVASPIVKSGYENSKPEIKEGLCLAFLLNLAYWKLTRQFTDNSYF